MMRASERLTRAGIAFERTLKGSRLIVRHAGRTVDFWPRLGVWIDRAAQRRRLGVRALIRDLLHGRPAR